MKIDEVTVDIVMHWARVDETDADSIMIKTVIMPAAKEHMQEYTGLRYPEMIQREDLTPAYLALCAFLYDNRSMVAASDKENRVIQSFLDKHQMNLL